MDILMSMRPQPGRSAKSKITKRDTLQQTLPHGLPPRSVRHFGLKERPSMLYNIPNGR